MTFDSIWSQLVRKRPALQNDESTLELKSANLRALLRQVYEQGQKSVQPSPDPPRSGVESIFDPIFGGRR